MIRSKHYLDRVRIVYAFYMAVFMNVLPSILSLISMVINKTHYFRSICGHNKVCIKAVYLSEQSGNIYH